MDVKRRKPNWSERELVALAEAVAPHNPVLKAKFSPAITADRKQGIWKEIVDQVNSITMVNRTMEEIKKKWADMQSVTKKKEAERRKSIKATGGGPGIEIFYKTWENLVLQSLSEVAIEGISGGVDTAEIVKKCSSIVSQYAMTPCTMSAEPSTDNDDACSAGNSDLDITSYGASNNSENEYGSQPVCTLSSTLSYKKKLQTKGQERGKEDVQEEFLKLERQKKAEMDDYRKRKLEILEEMLRLQRRSTEAVEKLASSDSPSLSLSPTIKFY